MDCPKCGYTRKSKESVPETRCPSCGVYYAKVVETVIPVTRGAFIPDPEERSSWGIGRFLALAAVVAGIAAFMPAESLLRAVWKATATDNGELRGPDGRQLRDMDFSRASIVMYSLTTCTYCARLRRTFEANRIPFTEHFVDTDPAKNDEMFRKLQAAGHNGGVGTPTLEVNGRMMPNNPPVADIIRQALS